MITCHLPPQNFGSRCSIKCSVIQEAREFLGGKLPLLCRLLPVSVFILGAETQMWFFGGKSPDDASLFYYCSWHTIIKLDWFVRENWNVFAAVNFNPSLSNQLHKSQGATKTCGWSLWIAQGFSYISLKYLCRWLTDEKGKGEQFSFYDVPVTVQ